MEVSNSLIKQMPVSIEAEQAVLGSVIIDPDCFNHIAAQLTSADFYLEDHKRIFDAIVSMYMQNKTIDAVTLVNALSEQNGKDNETNIQYISLIADSVPSVSNVKEYAKIVKEKSLLRKLIDTCEDINREAYDEADNARSIIDSAEQKIFDLANGNESRDFRHIRDILHNVYGELQTLSDTKGAVTGSKTGFSGLDKMLIQMGKGDLVIVGARPGMGKTSFAMNIATNVAKSSNKCLPY